MGELAKVLLQVSAFVNLAFLFGCSIGDTTLSGSFSGGLKTTASLSLENNLHFQIPEDANTQFVVKLSDAVIKDTRVDWAVFPDGGGDASSDFTAITGTSTIPKGEVSYAVTLPIMDDNLYEGNETFRWVFISYSEHLTVDIEQYNFTIIDNEAVPTLSFVSTSSQFDEGDGNVNVEVSVNPASAFSIDLSYTVGGSALGGGGDYDNFIGGTLTVSPGNATASLSIDLVDDVLDEVDETIALNLTGAVVNGSITAVLAAPNAHTLTIVDNENALLSITDTDPYSFGNVSVNGSSTYSFTLTNSGSGAATSIADLLGLSAPFTYLDGTYPGTGGNCGASLATGGSCVLVVDFAPTSGGSFSDAIELSYFDGMNSQFITHGVQGNGASGAVLTVSDGATYDYGLTENSTSKDHSFTISNTGGSPASSISLSGLAAPYDYKDNTFPGTGGDCGTTLAGGDTCTVVITFSPSASGPYPEQLVVDYNSGTGMTQVIRDMTGVGASSFTWTGLGGNSNWTTGGNWLGGSAPGVSDVAVFDQYCTNCSATINANANLAGITMSSGYAGTITQAPTFIVTVGASGYTQAGGTFVGGDGDVYLNGDFSLTGGAFISTSATLVAAGSFVLSGAPSFNHNSGTFKITANGTKSINPNSTNFNNVLIQNGCCAGLASFDGTMNIQGTLTSDTSNHYDGIGVFNLSGDLVVTDIGYNLSPTFRFVGSGNQTVTSPMAVTRLPNVEFAKAGGTLTFATDHEFRGNVIYTTGNLNFGTTRTLIRGSDGQTVTVPGLEFYDFELTAFSSGIATFTDNVIVKNDFTHSTAQQLDQGITFFIGGDVFVNDASVSAQTSIYNLEFNGTADQHFSFTGTHLTNGNFTVNKASGTLFFDTNADLDGVGQDFYVNNGIVNLNGHNLAVNDQLNVGDGVGAASSARILKACNTIAAGTQTVNPADGEIVGSSSTPNVTISDATVAEGGNLVFNVALSEGVCAGDFTVNYTVNSGTATIANSDYVAPATDSDATPNDGTLTLTSGSTSGTITIATTADGTMEMDETITVVLGTASHGSLIDDTGLGTIENDDDNGFIWTGDAGDGDFSNEANWSNGIVAPGASDIVAFTNLCSDFPANCNVNTTASVSVAGMWLFGSYPGIMTQSAGDTVTIGSGQYIQAGGTFVGGDSEMDLERFTLTGGTFTSTSSELRVGFNAVSIATDGFTYKGGTFNHNSGTVVFDGSGVANGLLKSFVVSSPSLLTFYNLNVDMTDLHSGDGYDGAYVEFQDAVAVANDLRIIDGYLDEGSIDLGGNLYLDFTNANRKAERRGSTRVLFHSGGNQQIFASDQGVFAPAIDVDNGTTVSPGAGTTTFGLSFLNMQSGSFNSPTGDLVFYDWLSEGATQLEGINITGGTFNHNNGHVKVLYSGSANWTHKIIFKLADPAGLTLNHLTVGIVDRHSGGNYDDVVFEIAAGHNLVLAGNLYLEDGQLDGGSIELAGDLYLGYTDAAQKAEIDGTTVIRFNDSGSHEIHSTQADACGPVIEVSNGSTVTAAAGTTDFSIEKLVILGGNFTGPTGVLSFSGRLPDSQSQIDGFTVNGGTFTHNNGTVKVNRIGGGNGGNFSIFAFVVPGGITLNNLIIDSRDGHLGGGSDDVNVLITAGHIVTLDGDLTIDDGKIDSGTLRINGDAIFNYTDAAIMAEGGTAVIEMVGGADAQIAVDAGAMTPTSVVSVNKPSAVLSLQTGLNLSAAGQDLQIIDGDIDLNGYDLTVNDQLNVGDGVGAASSARIIKGCSTITAGSQNVNSTDGEIVGSSSDPNITISDATVAEGGTLVFNVNLSEGVCAGDVTIDYVVVDGLAKVAGSDYSATLIDSDGSPNDGTLNISGGGLSGTISVATTADTTLEFDEDLSVILSNASHGTVTDASGLGIIENDDDNGYVWTGISGDNDFNNGANWSNGILAPGASDIAFFDGRCSDVPVNCDATTSTNVNVKGLWVASDFSGTITQDLGHSFVVGSEDWIQYGGIFDGGNSLIDIDGPILLYAGQFNSTSGELSVGWYQNLDQTVLSVGAAAGFNHNSGLVTFDSTVGNCSGGGVNNFKFIDVDSTLSLYDVTVDGNFDACHGNFPQVGPVDGDTIVVLNDFYHFEGGLRGNWEVYGDVRVGGNAKSRYNGVIKFVGGAPQQYIVDGGTANTGSFTIDKTAGTVTPSPASANLAINTLRILNGNFIAPSGTLTLNRFNTGDAFQISPGASFSHNNGTLYFTGTSPNCNGGGDRYFYMDLGGSDLDVFNVTAAGQYIACHSQNSGVDVDPAHSLIVNGDFVQQSGLIKGNWVVKGNISVTDDRTGGPASLTLSGSSNQTISYSTPSGNGGKMPSGLIIVDKPGGDLIFGSDISFNSAGQDLALVDGDIDLNNYDLTVNDNFDVGDGVGSASSATVLQGCSTITAGTTTIDPSDGEILGSGSSPIITIDDPIVNEGGNLVFTVSLSEPVCGASFTVNFATSNGTASSASDYTASSGTLNIPAGDTSGTINIVTIDDAAMEVDETVNVTLSVISHGSLGDSLGVGTIANNDDNGYLWTGNAGDGNFSNGANWSNGSVAPSSSNIAMFDGVCNDVPANCNASTSANINVQGLWFNSNYSGLVTQTAGHSVTVGAGNWIQVGGVFEGGNSNITIGGGFDLRNASFTSTTADLSVSKDVGIHNSTFDHNGGTFKLTGGNPPTVNFYAPNTTFNNLEIHKNAGGSGGAVLKLEAGSTVTVAGNMVVNMTGLWGSRLEGLSSTIEVMGDYTSLLSGGSDSYNVKLKLVGGNGQTVNGAGGKFPSIEIAKAPGAVVSFINDLKLTGHLVYSSGIVDVSGLTSLSFVNTDGNNVTGNVNVDMPGVVFPNLNVLISGVSSGSCNVNFLSDIEVSGDVFVNMQVSAAQRIYGPGRIKVQGNITLQSLSGGNAGFDAIGTGDQYIIRTGGTWPSGTFVVNKPSGKLRLLSNITLNSAGQDFDVQSGKVDMNGYDLTVNDQLSTSYGTEIIENCGALSYGAHNPANGTIVSSGSSPDVYITDAFADEGNSLSFTVTLSEPVCGTSFIADYASSDSTATLADSDYTSSTGTLSIPAKQLSGTITVNTTGDSNIEPDELLIMTLTNPSAGTLADAVGWGQILANEDSGFVWTGNTGDGDFSNNNNWSGLVVPGSTDIAIFDATCNDVPANCNVHTSASVNVSGLRMYSSYPGIFTQNAGHTISVGTAYWKQTGGTFVGGDSTIDLDEFYLESGSFTSTSGTLTVGRNLGWNPANDNDNGFVLGKNAIFLHNGGTVRFDGYGSVSDSGISIATIKSPKGVAFYNLAIDVSDNGYGGLDDALFEFIAAPSGSYVVEGNYTHSNGKVIGLGVELDLRGNGLWECVNATSDCAFSTSVNNANLATIWININGTLAQEYDVADGAAAPHIRVNTNSSFSPAAGETSSKFGNLELIKGTFNAPSSELSLSPAMGWGVTGTVNNGGFVVFPGASVSGLNSLVIGAFAGASDGMAVIFNVDVPTSLTMTNLTIDVDDIGYGHWSDAKMEIAAGDTLVITGNLTVDEGVLNGGSIEVQGNAAFNCADATSDCSFGGSTLISMTGSGNVNLSQATSAVVPGGAFTVGKDNTTDNVTLLTNFDLDTAGQDLNVTQGILEVDDYLMSVHGDANVNASGDVLCSGSGSWNLLGTLAGATTCAP